MVQLIQAQQLSTCHSTVAFGKQFLQAVMLEAFAKNSYLLCINVLLLHSSNVSLFSVFRGTQNGKFCISMHVHAVAQYPLYSTDWFCNGWSIVGEI